MARLRRRLRPGGHTMAVCSWGLCVPFSTDTDSHTHTARSLACPLLTLSSAARFSNGIFRSNDAPASLPPASSFLTHARRMDGFCNQNADQLGTLAGQFLLTVYVGVVECASASLSPASSSHTHARRMDGFCNQNADQLGSLAGQSLPTVYVGVVECVPDCLPPASSSLTHTLRLRPNCGNIFCGKILVPVNDRVFAKNDSQIFRRRQIEQILLQGKKFVFSRQGWVIVYSIPFAFL